MANKHDPEFTKHLATILIGARGMGEWGTEKGILDYKQLRLTIPARQAEVQKAVKLGMSQRQAAKLFGVSHTQIAKDIGGNKVANTGNKVSTRDEDEAASRARNAELKLVQPALIVKRYGTIVIDPPWHMEKIKRDERPNQVDFDYPTMTEEELVGFPVPAIAAEDCHLFCWATHKHLPAALRLISAWGFRYVLLMTWHKPGGFQPHGLPQYNSEFVIYARCGSAKFCDTQAFNTCFQGERREHSRKPDEFYNTIRRVTDGDRIDVFSREAREGFDQYGNEQDKYSKAI